MTNSAESDQLHLATIAVAGRRFDVSLLVTFDGIDHVGRLVFADADWEDEPLTDRGVISGRSRREVEDVARRMSEADLLARYRRAAANKRRYVKLRNMTDEFLAKVRYLNHVAVTMRAGLLDSEGAAQELDAIEHQLHEMVRRLRDVAGADDQTAA